MNAVLRTLLEGCRAQRGEVSPRLREVTRAFLGAAKQEPELLAHAAPALSDLPASGAAWLALTFGSAVEGGSDVRLTGPAVLALLDAWIAALPAVDEDEDEDPEPNARQAELLEVLPTLCQSAVTHLARMPQERDARAQVELESERLAQLQGYSYGAAWVREAVLKTSGKLLVLHPPSGRGVRLRYSNVSNCFHLFSLLQGAIGTELPGGRVPNLAVVAAARGESEADEHDEAWWHYGDPRSPQPDIGASIWGEANVRSIPLIDDARVLLVWPALLSGRSWDSGFFGPQLSQMPPSATLEAMLPAAEAHEHLKRLGIETP